MYEDIDYNTWGYKTCDDCKTRTEHNLVEVSNKVHHGVVYEILDSWLECTICDRTTPYKETDNNFPF